MATCTTCKGSGNTAARALLEYLARDILTIGAEGANTLPGAWDAAGPTAGTRRRMLTPPPANVGADGLALAVGLTGKQPLGLFGYGVESAYVASEKIIAAAGLNPATWGVCPACGGTGETEAPVE